MRCLGCLLFVVAAASALPPVPPSYDDASLRAVQFVDKNEGWACGDDGAVWHSVDGGKSWERQKTGTRASLRGLHFVTPYTGYIAGRTEKPSGSTGVLLRTDDGGMTWQDLGAAYLPGLDGVRFDTDKAGRVWGDASPTFPRGEFRTADGGQSWTMADDRHPRRTIPTTKIQYGTGGVLDVAGKPAALSLPPVSRGCIDFRGGCAVGPNVWVVGRPGSVICYSPDSGATWQTQMTGSPVPLHAIHMHSATDGVAVGDLGTVLRTADGGKSWACVKSGGQRAAVLAAFGPAKDCPVDILATLGTRDGYLTVAATLTNPESPALASAVRGAGGATADSAASLPYPAHAAALNQSKLAPLWTPAQREDLLRRAVLMIRVWKPDVILTGSASIGSAAELGVVSAVLEAARCAGDATKFPETLAPLGLTPHAPKKLYHNSLVGEVEIDCQGFDPVLADSPREYTAAAHAVLGKVRADARTYRLAWSADPAAASHKTLLEGCDLARGGTARRKTPPPFWTPEFVSAQRKRHDDLTTLRKVVGGAKDEAALAQAGAVLNEMPDPLAADAVFGFALEAEFFGKTTLARELYTLLANRYPTYPPAADAMRWLAMYHASGEHLRRLELAQVPTFRPATFLNVPLTAEGTIQVAYAEPAGRKIRFRSHEAERGWVGAGLDHEAKLFALDPQALRDPRVQLRQNAARQRLGLNADAERTLAAYYAATYRGTAGHAWADAVASELWLANRGTAAKPAKPFAGCLISNARPHLDGTLDDDCWKPAEAMTVTGPAGYTATAKFSADNEYLYVGVTCRRPAGPMPAKELRRGRDADVRGEDHVQILLDLDRDYSTYYRLRVDCRGRVADDCTGDASWSPNWFVSVEQKDGTWTAELAIPFAELTGKTPRPTHCWAVNAVRVIPGVGVGGWGLPADAEPEPEGMGLLEFRR